MIQRSEKSAVTKLELPVPAMAKPPVWRESTLRDEILAYKGKLQADFDTLEWEDVERKITQAMRRENPAATVRAIIAKSASTRYPEAARAVDAYDPCRPGSRFPYHCPPSPGIKL